MSFSPDDVILLVGLDRRIETDLMLCFYKSVLLRSLELHFLWKCSFLSLQGAGISVSKINIRRNTLNGICFEISLFALEFSRD